VAAAAALVVVFWVANRGPRWQVSEITGAGEVEVNGERIAAADRARLQGAMTPGARVVIPAGGELELLSAGALVLQITSGTTMTVPTSPGRWLGKRIETEIEAGEARLSTGPRFRGATLIAHTAETTVRVTGTTLTIIREPAGSCVCVLEGTVEMTDRGSATVPVAPGLRRYVFADARPPRTEAIFPMEAMKLGMLKERAEPLLDPVRVPER
jgi:ferric-dicitrate binding protein FerR (iron transport regulator)